MNDIYSELWLLDENRCTASGRQPGQGKRPWVNGNAQILIDTQVPASRLTDASMAQRALFAWVAPEVLAKPTLLYLVKLFDVFQHLDHQTSFSQAEEDAIDDFIKIVSRTAVMRRAFRYAVDVLGLDLEESEGFQDRSHRQSTVNFRRAGVEEYFVLLPEFVDRLRAHDLRVPEKLKVRWINVVRLRPIW